MQLSASCFQQILDCVENKLLDTLLILENAFGSLDDLDIAPTCANAQVDNRVVEQIVYNIYDDHSITVGEKASIKDSGLQ